VPRYTHHLPSCVTNAGKTKLADQVAFKSHLLIPWDLFWVPTAQAKALIQPGFGELLN